MKRIKSILIFSIFLIGSLFSCQQNTKTDASLMQKTQNQEEYLLFVGAYTQKLGHVDGKADGLYALKFNSSNGVLSETNISFDTPNPTYLDIDRKNQRIYVVNETVDEYPSGGGSILALEYDRQQEILNKIDSVDAFGGAPCYILFHDKKVMTANYVGGNHAIYTLKPDGTFNPEGNEIKNEGSGPSSRQDAPHAHMINYNPNTGQIYTVDLGTDEVNIYQFADDKLDQINTMKLNPGSGPRHIAFHPSEDLSYVINELSGTISVFKPEGDEYILIQEIASTGNSNNQDAACADIHVHPSGKFLYASNRGSFNSVTTFSILEDGSLKLKAERSCNGIGPRAMRIDPTGKYLLVANQDTDTIQVFEINQETGYLTDINKSIEVPTPVCLRFL